MFDDFIEIFKHSFHKFTLISVKLLGKEISDEGRKYYRFLGKFSFSPPQQIFESEIEENKPYIIEQFRRLDESSSNCFKRKFTKKILSNDKVQKTVDFQYIFDIVPKNVVDFKLDEKEKKIYLYVLGYGKF